MFKHAFQSGPSVPIFAPTGTKPCKQWTVAGNVSRSYDKASNGLAIECTGHSAKMSLPKRGGLDLRQRFLCVQLKLDPERQFTLGIGVESKDNVSTRRRLSFSTSFKSRKFSPLTAQVPLDISTVMAETGWVSLCIDLVGICEMAWSGAGGFKSLESIALGAECKLRKIFTLRDDPSTSDDGIPASLDFPLSMDVVPKLLFLSGEDEDEGLEGAGANSFNQPPTPPKKSPSRKAGYLKPPTPNKPAVAFGYRVKGSEDKVTPQKKAVNAPAVKEVKVYRQQQKQQQQQRSRVGFVKEVAEEQEVEEVEEQEQEEEVTNDEIRSVIERARERAAERRKAKLVEEEVLLEEEEEEEEEGEEYYDQEQDKSSFENDASHSSYDYDDANLAAFLNRKVDEEVSVRHDDIKEEEEEEVYNDENSPPTSLQMPPAPPAFSPASQASFRSSRSPRSPQIVQDQPASLSNSNYSFSQSFNYYMENGPSPSSPSNLVVQSDADMVANNLNQSPLINSPSEHGSTARTSRTVLKSIEGEVRSSGDFLRSYNVVEIHSHVEEEEEEGEFGYERKGDVLSVENDEKEVKELINTDEIAKQRLMELQRELEELEDSYSHEYGELGTSGMGEALEVEEGGGDFGPTTLDTDDGDGVVLMRTKNWGGEIEGEVEVGIEREVEEVREDEEEEEEEGEEEELDLIFIREGVYQDPNTGKFYCLKDD